MTKAKPAYKRILLKLSGEALMGDDAFGIIRATIERMVAEIAEVTENFEKRNAPKFLDPIDIDAKIEQLDTFIDEFRNEVHFILGEANNSVKIEIED